MNRRLEPSSAFCSSTACAVDAEPETAEPIQPEPVHHADEVAELEDISEVLTDSSPVAPSEPVADTTETDADADAGPQQPKRFNPWI